MKKNLKSSFVGLSGLFFLAACGVGSEGPVGKTAEYPFDGVWSGLITLQLGDDSCMRREKFILRVERGVFRGKTRSGKYDTSLKGEVNFEGEIEGGVFELGNRFRDAEMLGSFTDTDAEGTWKSLRCKGKWNLRRVQ